jgi:hypothetical protein
MDTCYFQSRGLVNDVARRAVMEGAGDMSLIILLYYNFTLKCIERVTLSRILCALVVVNCYAFCSQANCHTHTHTNKRAHIQKHACIPDNLQSNGTKNNTKSQAQ